MPLRFRDDSGQASVELVAALPVVLLLGAIAWQLALVGHAAWLTANAARVAARAQAVGRDTEAAARSALPRSLERGLEVEERGGDGVRVRVAIPLILPGPTVRVAASASLGVDR
jgi:hypothetical protein